MRLRYEFVQVVTNPQMCIEQWGKVIRERLDILESWAHKQGLELAAECHLAKINQCADFLQVITNRFPHKKEIKN